MSQIQWTQQTWNPILNCTQIIGNSQELSGCQNCYAMRQAYRNQAMGLRGYQRVVKKLSLGDIVWTGKVNLVPEVLLKPLQRQKPTIWFVNSMSDLFHKSVSFEMIDLIFGIMALSQQHTFQVLTKRPERMLEWSEQTHRDDWCNALVHYAWSGVSKLVNGTKNLDTAIRYPGFPLPNVWLGVSVESQSSADERIPLLLKTPAALRFLSCEPLLESMDLQRLLLE
jgi:protein gp37